jgi:hypothetical protein
LQHLPWKDLTLVARPLCRFAASPLKGEKSSAINIISIISRDFSPSRGECPKGEGVLKL